MMGIINFITELFLVFFPVVAGIIVGVINVRTYDKEYHVREWLFLVTVLVIATSMCYILITLK